MFVLVRSVAAAFAPSMPDQDRRALLDRGGPLRRVIVRARRGIPAHLREPGRPRDGGSDDDVTTALPGQPSAAAPARPSRCA